MGKSVNDLLGKRFGRLTVIKRMGSDKYGNARWECLCDCGNVKVITGLDLKQNKVKSCGCLRKERGEQVNYEHGLRSTRCYNIWQCMKTRCYNDNTPQYNDYGKRGIKVCDEWKDNPVAFYDWAMNNGYQDDLTIERIDVNGDYCPENCTWIKGAEQANNRRTTHWITFNGETKSATEWSKELGGESHLVGQRLKRGWTVEEAVTTPLP